jgi:metal-sulfur cluster biosynthetic enzyme
MSIVEMGLLDEIEIDGDEVTVHMHITSPVCTMVSHFIEEIDTRVGGLTRVESVEVETDSGLQWSESMMSDEAQARREARKEQLITAANANEEGGLPPRPAPESAVAQHQSE